MAEISINTGLDALDKHFCQMHRIFYIATPNKALSAITGFDMELPVLEDGVGFDTGAPNVSRVKITEGRTICSSASQGDPSINFQVASIAGPINDLLMDKGSGSAASEATVGGTIDGVSYKGKGYSLAPKKVTGALFMTSKDKKSAIYLPNVEMFASFNGSAGNDSTGYYNVEVTPLADANGAAFYPLTADGGAASSSSSE
jgi:hypothetical protein